MGVAIGDVIEFILEGNQSGLAGTRNIFHYEVSSANTVTPDSTFDQMGEAAKAFWDEIKATLKALSASAMVYTQVKSKLIRGANAGTQNLYLIPSDEQAGGQAAEVMPPFVAWGIRYQGAGGAQRNGYKRFAGVNEAWVTNGQASVEGVAAANALAGHLDNDITVFGGVGGIVDQLHMFPVIVKKAANGLDPSDITVIATWEPVGVTFYGVTSQNTRKIGRGI